MKLNWFETIAMNNPVRAWVQRHHEAPGLAALAPHPIAGAETLIIGCGRGVDLDIAINQYRVGRVTAIDLDPRQVDRARRRLGWGWRWVNVTRRFASRSLGRFVEQR